MWDWLKRIITPPKEIRKMFTPPAPVREFLGITDTKAASQLGFGAALAAVAAVIFAPAIAGGMAGAGAGGGFSAATSLTGAMGSIGTMGYAIPAGESLTLAGTFGAAGTMGYILPTAYAAAVPLTIAETIAAKLGDAAVIGANFVKGIGTLVETTKGMVKERPKYKNEKAIEDLYVPYDNQPIILNNTYFIPYPAGNMLNIPAEYQCGGFLYSEGWGKETGLQVSRVNSYLSPTFQLLSQPFAM